jgi:hypothetical protein
MQAQGPSAAQPGPCSRGGRDGLYTFLALDTRPPYVRDHEAINAGKTAYYLLRWQNTKGELGPWSDI